MISSLKRVLQRVTPGFALRLLDTRTGRRVRHFGLAHYCPVCQSRLRAFVDYGRLRVLKGEECPVCGSHRRHRLKWLYLRDRLRLATRPPLKLLHVAPEQSLSVLLQGMANIDYLSADLVSPLAMVKMDLTAIQFPDYSFDAMIVSHVLEYIEDDRRAMREMVRVLKPGGWAIVQTTVDETREVTLEDPSITSPEDRYRHYWHYDHIRLYGRDYRNRLEESGFEVTVDWFVKEFSPADIHRLGLDPTQGVYMCRKPPVTPNS